MRARNERNNPKKVFKEQDDLVVPTEKPPGLAENKLASVRRSEITSIAPDDINWDNIFFGKQHGLHSTRPGMNSRKTGIV